jgi:hypothetical protein
MKAELICHEFYKRLFRGGRFGMWWTPNGGKSGEKKYSSYVPVAKPFLPPAAWMNKHLYFGINPTIFQREYYQAARMDDIVHTNTFFADYDGPAVVIPPKDEVLSHYLLLRNNPARFNHPNELLWREADLNVRKRHFALDRENYKTQVLDRILGLPMLPSVTVDSGGGYQCVPMDTEILTRDGWKSYGALVKGEEVLGYNRDTEEMEWTTVTTKIYKRRDDLVRVSNGVFEAICTPDHRWVSHVNEGHGGHRSLTNQLVAAKDISRRRHKLVLSSNYRDDNQDSVVTPREAAILGWVATDGSLQRGENGLTQVRIAQSEKKFVGVIHELLSDVPHKVYKSNDGSGMVTWAIDSDWFTGLWEEAGLGDTKHDSDWCRFVMNLSREARLAFLDAAWLGDGHYEYGCRTFTQNPGNISEAIKLAIFLTGRVPHTTKKTDSNCERVFSGSPTTTWNLHVENAGHGPVWCPQTELGTWVMRQGDTICITGNCYWILDDTFDFTEDSARKRYKSSQKRWVLNDPVADPLFDIRRVFRAPLATGDTYLTRNIKAAYGPDYPFVQFVWANFDLTYRIEDLEATLPAAAPEEEPVKRVHRKYEGNDADDVSVIETYNGMVNIRDELADWGYTSVHRRMSRPDQENSAGVIIHDGDNVSVHFSTMDPLYSEHAWTPFGVLCRLGYRDNVKAAVYAAADRLGISHKQRKIEVADDATAEQKTKSVLDYLMAA